MSASREFRDYKTGEYDGIRTAIQVQNLCDDIKQKLLVTVDKTIIRIHTVDFTKKKPADLIEVIELDEPIYGIAALNFSRGGSYAWLAVGFRTRIELFGFGATIKDRFIAHSLQLKRGPHRKYRMVPNTLRFHKAFNYLVHYTEEGVLVFHNHVGKAYDYPIHVNFKKVHQARGASNLPLFRRPELVELSFNDTKYSSKIYSFNDLPGDPDDYFPIIYQQDNDRLGFGAPNLKVSNSQKCIRNPWSAEIYGEVGHTPVHLAVESCGAIIVLKNGFEYRTAPDGFKIGFTSDSTLQQNEDFKILRNGTEETAALRTFKDLDWDVTAAFLLDSTFIEIILVTRDGDIYLSTIDIQPGLDFDLKFRDWTLKKLEGKLPAEINEVLWSYDNTYIATARYDIFIIRLNPGSNTFEVLQNLSLLELPRPVCELKLPNFRHWELADHHVVLRNNTIKEFQGIEFNKSPEDRLIGLDEYPNILDLKFINNRLMVLTKEGLLNDYEPLIGPKIVTGSILEDGTLLYYQANKINYGPVIISFEEQLTVLTTITTNGTRYIIAGTWDGDVYLLQGREKQKLLSLEGSISAIYVKQFGEKCFTIVVAEFGSVSVLDEVFEEIETSFFIGTGPVSFVDIIDDTSLLLYNESNLVLLRIDENGALKKNYLEVGDPISLVIFDRKSRKLLVKKSTSTENDYKVLDPKTLRTYEI